MAALQPCLVFILGFVIFGVHGFLSDDPCALTPSNVPRSADGTADVTIYPECRNGTFDWNYPIGHFNLLFPNPTMGGRHVVCFKDWINGDVFDLYDITGGQEKSMGHVDRDSGAYICTGGHHGTKIEVRIDAPKTRYYMGALAFKVGH